MGKKYIIELLDDCQSEFKGIMVFGLTQEKQISVELIPEESLIPYTEPDMEQVRKEEYDRGYDDAKGGYENGFENGMIVAWEAARKICTNWVLPDSVLSEIFGMDKTIDDIMKENTASEAIEKIRAYEQGKEEQIQVGDEVETPSGLKGYVVNFTDDELVHYVSSEGRFGTMGTSAVSKTGRHFPEIAEVLQKMKES